MQAPGVVGCGLAVALLVGCDPKAPDFEDVKKDQREILYKLGGLDKSIQQMGSKPAGEPSGFAEQRKDYPNKIYTIPVGTSAVKGPGDAAVTIVEFSDFQCPPCGESRELVKRVLDAYPEDVRFVYKQFPLPSIHKNAMAAAKASVAAGKQGKFWEMHDVLYQNQNALDTDKLTEYAQKIGLDVPRWVRDFSSPEVQEQVAQDMRDGRTADVDATPTFFVNGKRMGQRSFEDFKQEIEEALRAKGTKKG
jgi:protein-disulfide isomerase